MRSHVTYSNVVSTLCLFLVLGGGAYAATNLPKNSVDTRQLRRGAVTGAKVANRSLTAADIRGPVNQATNTSRLDGLDSSAFQLRGAGSACPGTEKASALAASGDVTCSQDLGAPRMRLESPDLAGGEPVDPTPDVAGLSVLVLDFNVPTVIEGQPSFTGGVEGQRLTIVSLAQLAIFTDKPDLRLDGGVWSGATNDTLTLVLAGGVWYETGRNVI